MLNNVSQPQDPTSLTGLQLAQTIKEFKVSVRLGRLTYEEAKEQSKVYLDELNIRMARIAKKFGRKHYNISFSKFQI